ncbi:MAG: ABC transporter substrate-binding protein [Dehalococcoidia bacterium]
MKRNKLLLLCSIGLVMILTASFVVGCKAAVPPSTPGAKTLQIGGLIGLTGGFSVRDIPDWNQTVIAADLMNERGGITVNGQKYLIELVVEDTKSTMDGVTAAANRLVYDKGIKFIIGPTAFFSAAAGPVTDTNKVIRCLTWCCNTPGEMDASTPYAFLTCNASVAEAIAAAKYLKQTYPNVKKVVLVTPDDGAVPYLIPKVKDILQAEGLSLAGDTIAYSNDMIDMSPIAAKINAIKDADAVFQANGLGPHVGGLIKSLRELGNNKPYACALPTSLSEIATIAGKEPCKDVVMAAITADDPNLPPLAKEICKRTVTQYGADYSLYLTGADGLWDLKYVIEAAQSLDPTVVKAKWESLDRIETIFGTGTVGGEKTFGIRHAVAHPQAVQILKDGVVTSGGSVDLGVVP